MNNNSRAQNALLAHCKGVFSNPGWLNHGTPDEPVPYVANPGGPDRDAFKGKQFGVAATKTGKTPSSYFDPAHKYLAEGEKYVDRWPYAEQQPEKPKGFGTSDFSKRDEFALAIRMEQHRQQLRHESRVQKEAQAKLAAKAGGAAAGPAAGTPTGGKKQPAALLYDLVFNKQSEFCTKVRRDTLNPTALSHERDWGAYHTMAQLAHAQPGAAAKPQFVHRPAMAEFYRRSNVFFPQNCAAEPTK